MPKYLVYVLGIVWILGSCTPVKLVSLVQPDSLDLAGYRTYAFAELTDYVEVNRANSESIEEFVRNTVVRHMAEKGYELTDQDPDFLVDLEVFLLDFQREQSSTSRYASRRSYYYSYPYGYPYGYDPVGTNIETEASMEAVINLSMADASENRELGAGKVEAKLASNPKRSVDRLDEAVAMLVESLVKP